jgi:hypothetical protein
MAAQVYGVELLPAAKPGVAMPSEAIAQYAAKLDPQRAAICAALQKLLDAGLPQATSKLWHAIPVWFVGENPVVGFTTRKTGVMLMFWNGQHFDEPELQASGSFHMAQIPYHDVTEIDEAKLAGWLQKAATNIWDMTGERNAFVAKRRAAKAKPKTSAKTKKSAPKSVARKPKPAKKPAAKVVAKKTRKAPAKAKRKSAKAKAKK